MTKGISQHIKTLNVVLTLLIVALHTMVWEARMWPLRPLVNVAVPMFFVISSDLYFQRYQPTARCYWQKLRRRLCSLYVPFVVYNALYVPYILLKKHVLHAPDVRGIDVCSTDMLTSVFFGSPWLPNSVTWYLLAVLLFALFAPGVGWVCRRWWSAVMAMAVSLLCCHLFPYTCVAYWLPCLLMGGWLAAHEAQAAEWWRRWRSVRSLRVLAAVLVAGSLLFFAFWLSEADVFTSVHYFVFRMLAPWLVLLLVFAVGNLLPRRVVLAFSPLTLPVYCLHVVFVNLSVQAVARFLPHLHFALAQLLSFALALLTVVAVCMLLRRVPPLWRVLTGFRE